MDREIKDYISGKFKNCGEKEIEIENAMLTDAGFFDKFIEISEEFVCAAPENFASAVMLKINAEKPVKVIPFISRKMRAAACFCCAAAVMAMTVSGVNDKIFEFISTAVTFDRIGKIGEFLNMISKININ